MLLHYFNSTLYVVLSSTINIVSALNIDSGNVLVVSGQKPLPEPMLNLSCVIIWCHQATMS